MGRRLPGAAAILGLALCAFLLVSSAAGPSRDFWAPGDPGARADELLEGMSDEEVLGQLFMLAYPGDTPPPLLFDWIGKRGLGGIKIFGWNAEDTTKVAEAVAALQKAALASGRKVPLLIATDQEGGWIRHVKGATSQTPGNMAIGASGRPYDAYWSGYYIARELEALGINMNFAPAVDLATRPKSSIIGPRAFSDDPEESAALGVAYYRGTAAAGLIATAKHFPGHGDTELDSHGTLPVIRTGEKTLWERELVPFRALAAEGVPAVMSGHLNFPLVSGDSLPASLSRHFMTDILRGRLGFQGVAVTDDLMMAGAAGAGASSLSEAFYLAVEAGNDLLESSRIMALDDPAWTRLLSAYRSKPAFRARVREAARRVLVLKLDYLRPKGPKALVPDPGRLGERLPDREGEAFFRGQAFRGASALDAERLPWKPSGKILVAAPFADFLEAAAAAFPGAARHKFSYRPESAALPEELAAFERAAASADAVLVCAPNEAGMDFFARAKALGKRVAVVSVFSPAPLSRCGPEDAAVAVYGNSRACFDAGLAALKGEEAAEGRLPVKLSR